MSTKANSTKSASHVSHAASRATSHATTEPVASTVTEASNAPAVSVSTAATTAAAKPTSNTTVFVSPPPTSANIPRPPEEYAPATPGEFKNVVPRATELSALPQALIDLRNFSDYADIFGQAAPTLAEVLEAVTLGGQWSTMRATTKKWDDYCVLQEGLAWVTLRLLIARLGPIFQVAVQANPKLASRFPGLMSLLGAKKSIAQKGASTRRLNKQAKAEGKPEIHGVVGKKRQRQMAKAALAAASATNVVAPVVGGPAVATVAAAPSPTPTSAAVVAPAQVAVGTPAVVNGVGGASHS